MSIKDNKTVHINYTGYLVNHHNLQTPLQKHKSPLRLIFTWTKSFVLSLTTCNNLLTTEQRFDPRGVLDIQYCPKYIWHKSLSLITVARVHSTWQPCTSNQCNTTRLESKLTRCFKRCSSHPMRMNTCFQTRLNASYTDDYIVVRNNNSAIRGV
jgi:hypothetical protein